MQALKENHINDNENKLTLVQSYLAWWDMAGFDHAVDSKTMHWLEQKQPRAKIKNESSSASQDSPKAHEAVKPQSPNPSNLSSHEQSLAGAPMIDKANWPKSVAELHSAIASGAALPGNGYGNQHIAPHYLEIPHQELPADQKTIMLISDFPNENDLAEKSLISGREYQLIVNMLTAAGFEKHNIYCASLASTKPVYDELPEQDLPQIHAFIRYHIEVLDPDVIISLGSSACNALLGAELMKSRENLHYFNYKGEDKELLTTFHPKTLLARANLKRQAWRDLQLLMKKDIL